MATVNHILARLRATDRAARIDAALVAALLLSLAGLAWAVLR